METPATDGLSAPRRYWAVAAVCLGMVLSVMDASIANVALPAIARELQSSASSSVWIVNAYNLAVIAALLPFAALGERLGLKQVFALGMVIFMIASVGCMMSGTLWLLAVFRAVQGVGAAAVMSMIGGLTRAIYPSNLFGRGIGVNALTVAVSSVLGPTVSSGILAVGTWPWLFAINLPLGLIALYFTRFLPGTLRINVPFAAFDAALAAVALCLLIASIDCLYSHPVIGVAGVALAVALGTWLVRRSEGEEAPIVPIDLWRIPRFAYASVASGFSFAAQMASLVALPFHLQAHFNCSQVIAGVLMVAWPVGSGVMALVAGHLADRHSASILAGIGAITMAAALALLAWLPVDAGTPLILVGILATGVGFGFFQSPNNRAMLTAAPRSRSGAAGGAQATTRVFGQSLGAVLVSVALGLPMTPGQASATALLGGAACALCAVLVNLIRFQHRY